MHKRGVGTRTNVVLDDELVRDAFRLTGVRTKKDLIHLALKELIRIRRKRDLTELAGRVRFRKGFRSQEHAGDETLAGDEIV